MKKKKKKYEFKESIIITKLTSLTVESMTFLDIDRSMTCSEIDLALINVHLSTRKSISLTIELKHNA